MKKYRDHYFNKAKQDKYPARSVYKLQEIDKQFKILRPGIKVMDLGAAPGSWTLFAAKKIADEKAVAPAGCVLAADIQSTETNFPGNVRFMQEDVFERSPEFQAEIERWAPFDVIISDMAPKTTGHKFTDQARSLNLCEEAFAVATTFLKVGGHFVVKIFMGPDVKQYSDSMRPYFEKVKSFKPKSSRSESKEVFYIGLSFKGISEDA